MRPGRHGDGSRSGQVDAAGTIECERIEAIDRRHRLDDPGIVDDDVEAAEPLRGLRYPAGDRGKVSDVERVVECLPAGRRDLLDDRSTIAGVAPANGDGSAGLGKR